MGIRDALPSTPDGYPGADAAHTLPAGVWVLGLIVLLLSAAVGGVSLMMSSGSPSAGGGDGTGASTTTPRPEAGEGADSAGADRNRTAIRVAIHDRVNEIRTDRGLDPLAYDNATAVAAQNHSELIAKESTLEHSSGSQYGCSPFGENLAVRRASGNETEIARGVVGQWMDSEVHRQNILSERFTSEGVGVATAEEDGLTMVYATQGFCG